MDIIYSVRAEALQLFSILYAVHYDGRLADSVRSSGDRTGKSLSMAEPCSAEHEQSG